MTFNTFLQTIQNNIRAGKIDSAENFFFDNKDSYQNLSGKEGDLILDIESFFRYHYLSKPMFRKQDIVNFISEHLTSKKI